MVENFHLASWLVISVLKLTMSSYEAEISRNSSHMLVIVFPYEAVVYSNAFIIVHSRTRRLFTVRNLFTTIK